MTTLHEVKQVTLGEHYIMTMDVADAQYVFISGDAHKSIEHQYVMGNKSWWYVFEAKDRNARFYGPVVLQPAQESAGESEAG